MRTFNNSILQSDFSCLSWSRNNTRPRHTEQSTNEHPQISRCNYIREREREVRHPLLMPLTLILLTSESWTKINAFPDWETYLIEFSILNRQMQLLLREYELRPMSAFDCRRISGGYKSEAEAVLLTFLSPHTAARESNFNITITIIIIILFFFKFI